MKRLLKWLLNKIPYVKKHVAQSKLQGAYPAGHYYSPIPSKQDIESHLQSINSSDDLLKGIDLNKQHQEKALNEYKSYYNEITFTDEQIPSNRYYYKNSWFSYSDAIFLYCFLRKQQPNRIIEVGSGFSSAATLDTVDSIQSWNPKITFIEPYPDRLNNLLKKHDEQFVEVIHKKIQDVPTEIFSTLQTGDFLFIDSSHILKCGSDLHLLLFKILPSLKPGVFVHFHDVFYPFDYPSNWLSEGRYWNENYFLRAFLSYNSEWEIHFFNSYVHTVFTDIIKESMPLCTENKGGSLYISRKLHN